MEFLTKNKSKFLLFLLLLFALLYGNNSPLYDQDEAAYMGFSKSIMTSGDFLKMDFPFSKPHRKPPLHFWLTSIQFYLFGISEFVLRLLPTIYILCTVFLTYLLGTRLFGDANGILGAMILGFSLYFPLNGKIALVDSLLVFCETLGFVSLVYWILERSSTAKFLFWLSISLGTLAKGPPILIFLGGICFVLLFRKDTRSLVWSLHPFVYLPVTLLPFSLWVFFVWKSTNGELIQWMWEWYVLRRATNPVFGQSGPPGTYFILFFIGLFPWSYYLFGFWIRIFKNSKEWIKSNTVTLKNIWQAIQTVEIKIFVLGAGLFFSWIFYEFLASKLPSYPLAAYPILSIILANYILKFKNDDKTIRIFLMASVLISLTISIFLLPYLNKFREDTQSFSKDLNTLLPIHTNVFVNKNLALPSLAVYSHLEFTETDPIFNPEKGYYLITDEELLVWQTLGYSYQVLLNKKSIFAYDRNKTFRLSLVRKD